MTELQDIDFVELSDEEMHLYSRQISLDGWDIEAQEKLKLANVLIVGAGGIGCSSAELLARAGVGKITLIDADTIEISNLQRQIAFGHEDIGRYKAEVLAIEDGIVTTHYVPPRKGSNWAGHPIYGGMIVIEHKNGYESLYAHLSSSYVREGQKVKKGDIIGRMGGTGKVKGEHLHLEIIKENKNLNPLKCFNNIFVDVNGNLYIKE